MPSPTSSSCRSCSTCCIALALVTRQADLLFVVLAWLFVVSRIVHAAIHSGGNNVVLRFQAYVFGLVVLAVMWIAFAVGILASGA